MKTKVSVSSLPGSCCIHDCNGLLALSRSLSVSSVSSVSSASSSSSSVRSADSEDMYADLASPVSSASSRSPTPAQQKKGRGTWFGVFSFFLQGVLGKGRGSRDLHTACLVILWPPGKLLSRGQTFVADCRVGGSPEASPKEGETMEEGGCGANTHSRPPIPTSLAVKMPFPAWEFCPIPPFSPHFFTLAR